MIEVAAAVIRRADGAFLLARRPPGKVYAGWWEFPGGKIEQGESAGEALARELHEELGIHVRQSDPWITRSFSYPHGEVRLNFRRVRAWSGEPHPREGQTIRWLQPAGPLPEPLLPANAPVLAALELPEEYAITAAETMGEEAMLDRLEVRLGAGLRLVQLRDKSLAEPRRAAFAVQVVRCAHRHGARVLVNGDAGLARRVGADGVHYSARDVLALTARPRDLLVAASCHTRGELDAVERLEFDFAVLGAVRATPSHPGAEPLGWERFSAIAAGAALPVYAIGGLGRADLDAAWSAGAHGIAMIRGSWT